MLLQYKKQLRKELKRISDPKTKLWFESYMKHKERYIGVKTPAVERIVILLAEEMSDVTARKLSLSLLESPYTEEKLAGMILYQKKLIKNRTTVWRKDLGAIKKAVEAGHVSWWNTCDWLCVRILGRVIAEQGRQAALEIAAWIESDNLWLRRMSLVSFVNHAKKGDRLFAGNTNMILANAKLLVRSNERFHQTAVGWVIRELYKGNPKVAKRFILQQHKYFSREGLRYAIEKMPEAERKRILTKDVDA